MEHGTFMGWIGDDVLHSLYRIADLCVIPSLYEPFGIVALEAMASGCPTIVADTGGLREVVDHEKVGLRFNGGDAEHLAFMVERMLTDHELSDRLVDPGGRARAALRLERHRAPDGRGLCRGRATRGAPGSPVGHHRGMPDPPSRHAASRSAPTSGPAGRRIARAARAPRCAPVDVSTRCRVLRPTDRMRYSPGSLVVVVSASPADRDAFINRVIEEKGAVFTLAQDPRADRGPRARRASSTSAPRQLQQAAVTKRLEAGESVVIGAEGLGADERDRWVRIAHGLRRPRHVVLLETAKEQVGEDDATPLNELRTALDSGELGAEGFQTAMRLGGASIDELKRIVFRPAPRDD